MRKYGRLLRRRDDSRNIRARDLLLVPSGSPESRNIPKEFDGLLAFLGRGRTTGGRTGKRNGVADGRAAKEKEKGQTKQSVYVCVYEREGGERERGAKQENTKERGW